MSSLRQGLERLQGACAVTVAATTLALSGCAPAEVGHRSPAPATLSNDEIVAVLDQRVGDDGCCVLDSNQHDAYRGVRPTRELHYLVRRQMGAGAGAEEIACGYSGFRAPPRTGRVAPPPLPDTIFIVRGRRLILDSDVDGAVFNRMQKDLCGPDWMPPEDFFPTN